MLPTVRPCCDYCTYLRCTDITLRFQDPAEWGNGLTDRDFYVLTQPHHFPELVPFSRLTKSFPVFKLFSCCMEQKPKGKKTDFHRETQDGPSSHSVVSWSTPGTTTSVGITHQSTSSWAAVGGQRGASDSTLELTETAGPHWCQHGGDHGLDTMLRWQKASSGLPGRQWQVQPQQWCLPC